jgi:hypothetical protein
VGLELQAAHVEGGRYARGVGDRRDLCATGQWVGVDVCPAAALPEEGENRGELLIAGD